MHGGRCGSRPGKIAAEHGGLTPSLLLAWFVAVVGVLDVGDLERAQEDVWDRVAFMTRYGNATLTEALMEIDRIDATAYVEALSRLIKAENATRD